LVLFTLVAEGAVALLVNLLVLAVLVAVVQEG
jgi:hypothetical protein